MNWLNMKVLNKLALNYLVNNKKKTIMIIVSIILTTSLLFSLSLGASTLRQNSIDEAIKSEGSHHVIFKNVDVSIKNLKSNTIKDLLIIQKVEEISSDEIKLYKDISTLLEAEGDFILQIKSLQNNFGDNISLVRGQYPKNNREIIIPNIFASNGNFKIGDEISGYKIVGIYGDTRLELINYIMKPNSNTGELLYRPIVITKDDFKEGRLSDCVVTYKSNFNLYNQIYKDADALGLDYEIKYGNRYYQDLSVNSKLLQAYGQYADGKKQISSYLYLIIVLSVISIFCIIAINNAFSISYSERKKHFGILKSLGASKKQIIQMLSFEVLILSSISIFSGILLGFGITNLFIFIVNKMLENVILVNFKMIVYPSYLFVSLIFIIITILISSLIPAIKSSKTPAIAAIKEIKRYRIEKSKESYPLIKKIFGYYGELAYKNIRRNKSKFRSTVLSLTASIVLFISLSCFIDIIASQNTFDSGSQHDIEIQVGASGYQNEFIEDVRQIVDYGTITVMKSTTLIHEKKKEYLTTEAVKNSFSGDISYIQIIGLEDNDYDDYIKVIGLKDETKTILYNLTSQYNEETKDYSYYQWFNNSMEDIKICSVSPKNQIQNCYYTFSDFYLTQEMFDNSFHMPTIVLRMRQYDDFISRFVSLNEDVNKIKFANNAHVGINSKKFVKIDKQLNDLIEQYKNIDLEISYNSASMDNYDSYIVIVTIRFVLYSVLIFIVIISLTNIINTLNTSLSLRETEFSVLRSIGLSKKGLNNMIKQESLFLGIRTLVCAIPISTIFVIFQMLLSKNISENNKMMIDFPINTYIISVFGILIIILIMQKYSLNKIKNKNIMDSIRNESI